MSPTVIDRDMILLTTIICSIMEYVTGSHCWGYDPVDNNNLGEICTIIEYVTDSHWCGYDPVDNNNTGEICSIKEYVNGSHCWGYDPVDNNNTGEICSIMEYVTDSHCWGYDPVDNNNTGEICSIMKHRRLNLLYPVFSCNDQQWPPMWHALLCLLFVVLQGSFWVCAQLQWNVMD